MHQLLDTSPNTSCGNTQAGFDIDTARTGNSLCATVFPRTARKQQQHENRRHQLCASHRTWTACASTVSIAACNSQRSSLQQSCVAQVTCICNAYPHNIPNSHSRTQAPPTPPLQVQLVTWPIPAKDAPYPPHLPHPPSLQRQQAEHGPDTPLENAPQRNTKTRAPVAPACVTGSMRPHQQGCQASGSHAPAKSSPACVVLSSPACVPQDHGRRAYAVLCNTGSDTLSLCMPDVSDLAWPTTIPRYTELDTNSTTRCAAGRSHEYNSTTCQCQPPRPYPQPLAWQ
jgi:hypothetical protein